MSLQTQVMEDDENKYLPEHPWIACLPIMLAIITYALDGTIANVALPHMAGSFAATRDESMWILTSYIIAGGIVIPSVSFFSKLFGRKNFFTISILLFTIASFLCGTAQNMAEMVFYRILQGAGGGGLLPIAQALMMESFPKNERGKSIAVFGMGVIVAPIVGPVLGGWITDNWTWPWIYFINVPIGCIAAVLSHKLLFNPPYARKQKNVKIDWWGFVFLILWLSTLQVFFDKGNNADWFNTNWIRWLFSFSCLNGALFFISQILKLKKKDEPLVDLSVFKDRSYAVGTLIQIIMAAVLYATVAILPQFLQNMMGYTAYLSGLSMMPRGVGALSGMIVCAFIADKVDKRFMVITGLLLMGSGAIYLGFLNLQISKISIMLPNMLMGFGTALAMTPIINLSMETLTNQQMTNASGLQNLLKNIGGAIGTSLVGTMLTRFAQVHQNMLVGNLTPLNDNFFYRVKYIAGAFSQYASPDMANHMANYQLYRQLIQQSTLMAFMDALRIFGLMCIIITPLILFCKTKTHKIKRNKV